MSRDGSMRAPTVMADLIEAGYTVCGPDCGCSCLDAARSSDAGLREALTVAESALDLVRLRLRDALGEDGGTAG